MTIEMLSRRTILVSLCEEDMRRYALCFEEKTPQPQLRALLYHIAQVCGLERQGKSWLIEALPAKKGCLLIVSLHTARRRVYRVKRSLPHEICVFFDADAMLAYLKREDRLSGFAIYRYRERYLLLPHTASADGVLGEYGEICPVSAAATARVREHGTLLRQEELQRRHICGGGMAVRDAAAGHGGG